MKRTILIAGLVCVTALQLGGCAAWTPEQRQAFQRSWQQGWRDYNDRRLREAQIDYYSRPYKQGNVTIIPHRR